MTNAWSLLYDELYGDEKMTDKKENDPLIGAGNTASLDDSININTASLADGFTITGMEGFDIGTAYIGDADCTNVGQDWRSVEDPYYNTNINIGDIRVSDTSTPGIESDNPRKYKEDESIKALQDYISTTYGGHYTSDNNNVQTLDLIESVGDAESFCRSNAIKYLSRYDKKGQAKRDILKALHYTLLLYHFSGQLNETPTRGYETF
jgi:hypothetical protein